MDSRKEQGPVGKPSGQQHDLSYYIILLDEKGRKNSPHDTSKKRYGSICRPQFNHCLAEEGIDVTLPVYGLMNCRHAYIEYMETGNIYFLPAIYGLMTHFIVLLLVDHCLVAPGIFFKLFSTYR